MVGIVIGLISPAGAVVTTMLAAPDQVPEAAGRLRGLHWVRGRDPALTAVFQGAFLCAMAGCFTVGLPAVADSIGTSAIIYTVLTFVYPVGGPYVATSIERLHGRVG